VNRGARPWANATWCRAWWKRFVFVAALAIVYYMLGSFVFDRMPYTAIPAWWAHAWPRRLTVMTWFQLLNVAGAAAAALPIAILVVWRAKRHAPLFGMAIAAPSAINSLVRSEEFIGNGPGVLSHVLVTVIVLFGALLLAIPLWVLSFETACGHWSNKRVSKITGAESG
jgi:hypothetical protein